MKDYPQSRHRAVFLVLAALLPAACDDGAGPAETRVTAVQVAGGDQQVAPVATALPQTLVARAVDAQGQPVANARVTWQTTAGTVTGLGERTDAQGQAQAQWTLGTTAGQQAANIVIGTASATFRAEATAGAATSVAVTPSPVVLDAIGATAALGITARDTHGNAIEGRAATWLSTDPSVVTVSAQGVVTAVKQGAAKVRATLDGTTGEVDVTVQQQPASVVVTPANAQFAAIGATVQFAATAHDRLGAPVAVPAGSFAWSSSAPTIVAVSATGLGTAVGNGVAQVRAALGAVTGQTAATVAQAAVSIAVSPRLDTLTTARPSVQLTLTGTDANGQPIVAPTGTWTSAQPAIAAVSATGLVTGLSNGTARIRVTSGTASDSATIVVRLDAAPRAVDDTLGAAQNTQRDVAAPGLLANDVPGIPANATITSFGGGSAGGAVTTNPAGTTVTFGTGGSLRVHADGSLTFVPSTGFTGTFAFQYRTQNGVGVSDATVTINVGLPPVAAADVYATTAGTPLQIALPGVLANDALGTPAGALTSFGGGSLTGTTVTSFAAGQRVAFGSAGTTGGVVQLNADGSLSFTPPVGFTGAFTLSYRLSNTVGTSDATITINVN